MLFPSLLLLGLVGLVDVASAALSAGCGSAPPAALTPGTNVVQSITVNGQQRQYTIRVPANYQNNYGHKLIYGVHWVGGRMDQVANGGDTGSKGWKYFGMQILANETAIFVAPQGVGGNWANTNGADIAFFDAMNKQISATLCVDEAQRFSIGFSYGASMTYSIACSRAKDFRGVAVIAGGILSGCSGGNDPIAYFGIHGIKDGTLPISGGRSLRDHYAQVNGCNSMAGAKEPTGEGNHISTDATGCKTGYPVRWGAHRGGHIQAAADAPAPEEDGNASWVGPEVWAFWNSAVAAKPSATATAKLLYS